MQEIWKSLEGLVDFGEYYEVSNLGNVRSIDRMTFNGKARYIKKGRDLRITKNGETGYLNVTFSSDGKKKTFTVHRLVALAFLDNPLDHSEVNHKNGDKENNTLSNLEWTTSSDNKKHAYKTGLRKRPNMKGVKNYNAKLSEDDVEFIRDNYKPYHKEFSGKNLAKRFNVSESLIYKIVNNDCWEHA